MRIDNRANDELRPIVFIPHYTIMAKGSVLAEFGDTKVLCTASLQDDTPRWLKGTGKGWITAEYSLLPGSSFERVSREAAKGRQSGRTQEIQRLIGRALRAVCDLTELGERQIILDCDVLQADGGTRTAAICGAYLALEIAVRRLLASKELVKNPIKEAVGAVSVGIVDGSVFLDLNYNEDSRAETDMNVVMTASSKFVEIQGTAEKDAFSKEQLDTMLEFAAKGIKDINLIQEEVLKTLNV
jgi:ribonuclease PH